MIKDNVFFIGGGNMAEGIIRSQIESKNLKNDQILLYEINPKRSEYMKALYSITLVEDVIATIRKANIVFVAVRPQNANEIIEYIHKASNKKALVLSICAGVSLDSFEEAEDNEYRVARIMPNVLSESKRGYSGVCVNNNISEEDKKTIANILDPLGQIMFIEETMFDAFTAFSCAGPAFIMNFISAMIDAGVQSGFSRVDSRDIVLSNMIGSARTLEITGKHPYDIIDSMTSPAGVTIEGIKSLNEDAFSGIVMRCVEKSILKTKMFEN